MGTDKNVDHHRASEDKVRAVHPALNEILFLNRDYISFPVYQTCVVTSLSVFHQEESLFCDVDGCKSEGCDSFHGLFEQNIVN